MVLMGMISSVYVLSFTYVKEIVPTAVQTTAIGFTNALCVGTVPIFQPLIGYLLQVSASWRHGLDGVDVYDAVDYQIALSVLPAALLIAAVLAWYIFAKAKVPEDDSVTVVA